ncbi:MAG: M15 family metallopeptidase [Jatrophihabitans sp.]
MVALRWSTLVVLLLVVSACTSGRHPAQRPSASASVSAPTTPLPSGPQSTVGATPALPSQSRSAPEAAPKVPPVSAQARAAGLVDIRTVVPDAVIDLRYATSDNFTHVQLYPSDARCLVHQTMVAGLATAASRLRRAGYMMVFWDCYRPHAVQVRMFKIVPDPEWVARPGPLATSHEAGRSVDITLARTSTGSGCPVARRVGSYCTVDMGTGFDDFTSRAYAYATSGVSAVAQSNRSVLRSAMSAGGLAAYSSEWWHFDGAGAGVGRPHLNAAVN